jgi:hypothetical protein
VQNVAEAPGRRLLEALLDSWERNNTILLKVDRFLLLNFSLKYAKYLGFSLNSSRTFDLLGHLPQL